MLGLRENALRQHQHDLERCVDSRNQAIRSLLITTTKQLQIAGRQYPRIDLASFLEANNVANGPNFEYSTLPSTAALPGYYSPRTLKYDTQEPSVVSSGKNEQWVALNKRRRQARNVSREPGEDPEPNPDVAHTSLPSYVATEAPSDLDTDAQTAQETGGHEHAPLKHVRAIPKFKTSTPTEEPNDHPAHALTLSSDDAASLDSSALKTVAAEQSSGSTRIPQLPLKEGQEDGIGQGDHASHAAPENLRVERHHEGEGKASPSTLRAGQSLVTTGPALSAIVDRPPEEKVLKSQIDIARAEAFAVTPSTPDEQLRLEQAQSMQLMSNSDELFNERETDQSYRQSMLPPSGMNYHIASETSVDNSDENQGRAVGTGGAGLDDKTRLPQPASGMRDHMINGEVQRDLTLSRRPPMRIDTGVPSAPAAESRQGNLAIRTPSETGTPNKPGQHSGSAQSPPERMTTRVSSGALRHKSVSEILGETPKATTIQADKSSTDRGLGEAGKEHHGSLQTPSSATSFVSPDPAIFRQRLSEIDKKDRSKLSTVVFAGSRIPDTAQALHSDEDEASAQDKDYLLTLFNAKASKTQSLNQLIKTASKTLSTRDYYTDINERQACQVLSKIYDFQSSHRWSFRQLERSQEPSRSTTHWDVMLGQMKWLRADYREERKWKIAAARFVVEACAAWVAGTQEERTSLQVKVRATNSKARSRSLSASTPDLVHSADDEISQATDDDFIEEKNPPGSAPAAMFTLPPDMFVFGLNRSPVADKLLLELPLYQPNAEAEGAALRVTDVSPDATWKKPLVPVSKLVDGKVITIEDGPLRKKSRFSYQDDDQLGGKAGPTIESLDHIARPIQEDVALFDPENKHIRDRIHAGHAFRPPSEYIMPSQSFFESRQSSQWTSEEDHELRQLVREYAYNWSLISSCLALPSMFTSGAERRTPWECFERWISLEGLPVEMAKINYFRQYHVRLQAAQRTVEAQHHALQQSQGSGAVVQVRRRTTQPYTVERRKNARHLHLIDAMRKLAKKREAALHKQQHVATLAAMRKSNEPVKQRPALTTPQEFSRLKHDRAQQQEEKNRMWRMQMLQQQRAAQAAKVNQQNSQMTNSMQQGRNPPTGVPNGGSPNMGAGNPAMRGGDPRAGPQMQRLANGQTNGILPTNSHGVPHAPMQPNLQVSMQMQQRVPPNMASDPTTRIVQEAHRVQAEQVAIHQMRQQRQPQPNGQLGSPLPNPSHPSQNSPAMLGSIQGRSSPSINGAPHPVGSSTSPRMAQAQSLSSGMTPAVNQIASQFKASHPELSNEQISRLTTNQLYKMSHEVSNNRQQMTTDLARQQAMQAVAGNSNMNAVARNNQAGLQAPSPMQQAAMIANGGNSMNMDQYSAYMRSQQASQSRVGSSGSGQALHGSRSNTPMIQRTGSAQGAPRPSQSPNAMQVGLAGGQ